MYELLGHLLDSPDLVSSNFRPFPNLMKFLTETRFGSNEKEKAAIYVYFVGIPKSILGFTLKLNHGAYSSS